MVQVNSQARPLMPLTIQACICVAFEDATDLQDLADAILEMFPILTFFLLQATHALGARNGGGLNLSISRATESDMQLEFRLHCDVQAACNTWVLPRLRRTEASLPNNRLNGVNGVSIGM